ncbi:MAG: mechanosensitive ion channel family protein [Kiritimatiellaeota bacterium]|nr:mechanosensitive ion channel family protein [Kiritimatiellota bacterium]
MFHFLAQQPAAATEEVANHMVKVVQKEVNNVQKMTETIIEWFVKNSAQFFLDVLIACVIALVGAYLIRLLTFSTRKLLQKSHRVNELIEVFICSVVQKVAWGILLMLILQRLGINVAPLIAGVGVMGFIIGFACQESLANLAAGMMIALNQPFKVGDFVLAGEVQGSVTELNMMATTLLTPDYKKITVPNKVIWGSPITNYSAMGRRRVEITVGIAYSASIEKAKQVALDTLRANPLVLTDPAPIAEVVSFGDSSVNFVLRPWCKPSDYWAVHFAVTRAIKEAFDKNGIEIPFPNRTVHLLQGTAPSPVHDGDRTL